VSVTISYHFGVYGKDDFLGKYTMHRDIMVTPFVGSEIVENKYFSTAFFGHFFRPFFRPFSPVFRQFCAFFRVFFTFFEQTFLRHFKALLV